MSSSRMRGQEGEVHEQHCGTVSGPLQPVPSQMPVASLDHSQDTASSAGLSGLRVSLA